MLLLEATVPQVLFIQGHTESCQQSDLQTQ